MKTKPQEWTPEFKGIIKIMSQALNKFDTDLTDEYNQVQQSFEAYNHKNGIITPASSQDLFSWLALKYPDAGLRFIVAEAKKPHNYKLFHEYKELLFEGKWSDEQELKKWDQQPADTLEISKTKRKISEIYELNIPKGWKYAFFSEEDFKSWIDLLTTFFEYKPYSLPKEALRLKPRCTTKLAVVLREIHKELSNSDTLKNDDEFFDILRVLNEFKNKPNNELYKALIR